MNLNKKSHDQIIILREWSMIDRRIDHTLSYQGKFYVMDDLIDMLDHVDGIRWLIAIP